MFHDHLMKSKKSSEILVSQFFVAGSVFTNWREATLKKGGKVTLAYQPDNPADYNAIQVFSGQINIGWVPRNQTHEIRDFDGKFTRAEIFAYEPTNATHRMILVNVYGDISTQFNKNFIC